MVFRNRFALGKLLFYLAVYTCFRILLYFLYYGYFSELSVSLTLLAFFDGIRFDISILLTFVGLPLFLINLPVNSKIWLKSLTIIASIIFLAMVLLLSGDVIYFDVVKRHLGDDLLLAIDDTDFIIDFAFKQFWYIIIFIAVLFTGYIWLLFKIINKGFEKTKTRPIKEFIIQIAIILLAIICIRGTFGEKPINIINAFGGGSSAYGNLTLNGVFSVYHISRNSNNVNHSFFAQKTAFNSAINKIVESDESVADSQYPICRKRNKFYFNLPKGKKLNVVILLLESWTPKYIDSYSGKNFGVTPNFDSIANNGIKFTNCFANGDRSIFGITSTLLSLPQTIGVPYLGTGLELYNIFRIGKILDAMGYRTMFAQTSNRGSFRVDAIAAGLGFKEFYGMEDYPMIFDYQTDEKPYFGWDYEALMFLEKKISQADSPFFAYLFTGTTHEAYKLARKEFEKYPHESYGVNGYLNTLYYSDRAIGDFFRIAKTKPWFKNTIFILTADHTSKFVSDNLYERFHIPLVIYAPGLLPPSENNALVSQNDVPPTIFDLLNIRENYSGIGKSLMQNYSNRFVMGRKGQSMIYMNENGIIQHDLKNTLEYYFVKPEQLDTASVLKNMEKELLTVDQMLYTLFRTNKFYK